MTVPLPIRYLSFAGPAVVLMLASTVMLRKIHRKSAEEIEAERRDQLNLNGRIIDGTVLDYTEVPESEDPAGGDETIPSLQL